MKKKYILYIIAAMGAGLSLSHAAENTEFNGNNGGILIKDGVWIDTNLFSNGTPSPDKDLSAYGAWGRILYNTTVEVNNLFIKGGFSFLTVANGQSSVDGTVTTNHDESQIQGGTFDMSSYVAPTLIVNGNFSIYNDAGGTGGDCRIGSGDYRAGFKQIKVAGDIDLGKADHLRFGWDPNTTYSESFYALDVGGVVRMNKDVNQRFIINRSGGKGNAHYASIRQEMYARLGGIDGMGIISNNDPSAVKSTIVFQAQEGKTFQGGDWTGKIRADSVYNDANKYSEMKFIMDDTSGGGNKQILRLNPMGSGDTAVSDLNFEIRNGTLGLVMTDSSIKAKNISISGGVLEIAEPSKETTEFGSGVVYADNLDITGGEIMFTLTYEGGSFYSDHIEATNVTGRNGTFVIDLDENVFSIGNEIEETEVVLLYAISGDKSYDWNSSKLKITLGGVEVYLDKAFLTQSGDSLSATIGGAIAVPEPAEVAALLGLLSLSFAAYRRRK